MFKGKAWHPPVREEVEEVIKDRLSLSEFSAGDLEGVLSKVIGPGVPEETVQERLEEQAEELNKNLITANNSYYHNLNVFAKTVSKLETVNIVIPVYNSIHLTQQCIESVLKNTEWPYRLTVVDDASDARTNEILQSYATKYQDKITLLTNRKNRGFAATVNRGIKEFELTTKYTVLLNSDVLVTPGWLTKMVTALKSNPRNKIVNPVTNNTAVINVTMSPGFSYLDMNLAFERSSCRRYPEIMPTGFCFLMPNSLFGAVGYFDESYANFGEETDFWMRTITWSNGKTYDRWRAVLADDTYVFHQRGASYETLGEEVHMHLRKTASQRFRQQWPIWQVWNKSFNIQNTIGPLRKTLTNTQHEAVLKDRRCSGVSVCFLTHSVETCGGMHFIADIVNYINEQGGDARVAVLQRDEKKPVEAVAELRTAPIIFKYVEELEDFSSRVFSKGLLVAATAELAPAVAAVASRNPGITPVLHVQSYEPDFLPEEVAANFKKNFELIPNVISSSNWITKQLNVPVIDTINPGIDRNLFYPRDRSKGDERPTVMIAMNGTYSFKGTQRGIDLALAIDALARKNRKDIRIMAYGASSIKGVPSVICHGPLARSRISQLLSTEVDVFVDPAHFHSYGMPALEAIAAGVAVTGWDNKGIREYLPKEYVIGGDLIAPSDTSVEAVARTVYALLMDEKARKSAQQAQAKVALIDHHDRNLNVAKMATALQNITGLPKLDIVVVTPHARKHGGPTTLISMANDLAARGHNVKIAAIYTDFHPEVVGFTDLPIVLIKENLENLPACDVLITNSDNPFNPQLSQTSKAKRKILIKLSHNPRFKQLEEQGLNCKWDAIVTITQWLADVCENPGDWNYAPVKAHRIGWYHYNFNRMRRNPKRKIFNELNGSPIIVTTLVHAHPTKGSAEAGAVLNSLYTHYGNAVKFIGVGEVHPSEVKIAIPNMEYVFTPSRHELADIMFKSDVWLGCSHTEGLGRMALEAMTGGAVCVITDTGAEYAKHEENCLVCPVGDLNALANSVNRLIGDMDFRRNLSAAGYQTAKRMANPDACIDALEKVIKNVL